MPRWNIPECKPGENYCTTCRAFKPQAEMMKKYHTCRACKREYNRKYLRVYVGKDDTPETQTGWLKRGKYAGIQKERRYRAIRVESIYKLNHEEYLALHEKQNGACAACGHKGALVVDHDHRCCSPLLKTTTCGKCVRALLCTDCNSAFGHMKENPVRIRALADYAERCARIRNPEVSDTTSST